MSKQKPIIFVGSRHGFDFLTENCELLGIKILGFLERFYPVGHVIKGVECIGSELELIDNPTKFGDVNFFPANSWDGKSLLDKPEESGYFLRKERIQLIKDLKLPCCNLIHPDTKISRGTVFGQGCYTGRWVDIRDDIQIGDFFTALDYAAFGHDCIIGENCYVSVGGFFAGGVHVGNNVYVGAKSSLIPARYNEPLVIGNEVKIHSHAMVMKNMADGTEAWYSGKMVRRRDLETDQEND